MPQHTIFVTLHKRPGALTRTLRQLQHPDIAVVSVSRLAPDGESRLTIAATSRHAPALLQQLAEHPDVTGITDANLARRLEPQSALPLTADYREQADGAPYEAAA